MSLGQINTISTAKDSDGFLNNDALNKKVIDCFSFSHTEDAPIGTTPTLLNHIIPSIYFIFYIHPNKTFYFLGNFKVPKLRVNTGVILSQI